ncbi:germination protein YpeB [Lederbergia wuyishanensis]|uniref:Spore germination protein n=1 Tax=Lederbergia wuyishanensis TaxID=1347903 RepID=A0ABU0D109_9BACI|nr:germination protein YpeB [Lederbergia wuyishanensis]MCJ8006693.1 germination protein YpeB [Lederbergia wuyishanensis]MDQ0342075.1 spore germination protein [Lederbergia wuyishanensis]
MIRNILIVVLTIGIAGTAYWGYQEHQEKNAILINAENNYQRAFHDLTYQMDNLHEKIGTALAMNSKKSLSPALADVWRITSDARGQVGQLPLTLLPFNKTEDFLTNIGNFSYKTAVRDLDKEPLSKNEYALLKKMYGQSDEIRNELRKVQHLVLKNNLRWMDVELALASGKETTDNTIIDGFKTVEKRAKGYDEENLQDPTVVAFQKKEQNFDHLKGKTITKEEALTLAKKYSAIKSVNESRVVENGKGSPFEFYSVNLDDGKGDGASLDITKKGGYPVWLINHRDIGSQKVSLNDAMNKADDFLKNHGYKKLEPAESMQYDTVGLFTFVTNQNGVRIYPESIKVKVALDNGQIIGFSANDYLKGRRDRQISKPRLSLEDAKGYINTNVKVMENRLAIIMNELGNEVLCYEFIGTMDHDTYRMYINADNGIEEKVEKLKNAEPIYEETI